MPIMAKKTGGGSYENAPPGVHSAVCVDVVDLGMLEVTYAGKTKKQHKIRVVWQIGEDRADGKPFLVMKRYTLSLSEKATLRADLESWRGKPFSIEEEMGFDVERLIGVNCMLNVVHATQGENTYANVKAIMPLPKSMVKLAPRDYVRVADRPAGEADEHQAAPQPFGEITDEDIPF